MTIALLILIAAILLLGADTVLLLLGWACLILIIGCCAGAALYIGVTYPVIGVLMLIGAGLYAIATHAENERNKQEMAELFPELYPPKPEPEPESHKRWEYVAVLCVLAGAIAFGVMAGSPAAAIGMTLIGAAIISVFAEPRNQQTENEENGHEN